MNIRKKLRLQRRVKMGVVVCSLGFMVSGIIMNITNANFRQTDKPTVIRIVESSQPIQAQTLDDYKKRTPELFTQKGTLRAEYKKADDIIKRIERDPFFMKCMSGEKQVIMTGELFGAKWKIKMDSYVKGTVIVDLKVMSSITKHEWVRDLGPVDFIRYWGYDIQGAVYQEIVRQNTGKKLPFYIAAATKEDETNIEVIHVADNFLRDALSIVEANMPRVLSVKNGEEQPHRCGLCDYCRRTKVLTGPIGILDLLKDV